MSLIIPKDYRSVLDRRTTETAIKFIKDTFQTVSYTHLDVYKRQVIYSIYYVGVITDVREIGRLKALGASKKQIRRMLLREGAAECAVSVPIGLVLGYLIPYIAFPAVINSLSEKLPAAYAVSTYHYDMFSLSLIHI